MSYKEDQIFCQNLIPVQFTITYMHFDNYLQTKNPQPPPLPFNKFHYPSPQNNTQNSSFRHSTTSSILSFNKAPFLYLQPRPESSKQPVSNNFFPKDLKNVNLQQRPMNPIPAQIKSQVTANPGYNSLAPNCQKVPEQKKYINLSPAKQTNRMTTGIQQQAIPKMDQRRSQSVNDPRIKEISQNHYLPWCRQSTGALGTSKNTSHMSPFQLNLSSNQVFSDKNTTFYDRKQPIQKLNFFKTIDNQWSNTSSLLNTQRTSNNEELKGDKSFLGNQKQKKTNYFNTDSNLSKTDNFYNHSSISGAHTESGVNRQSARQDFNSNIATSKNLCYIQKDIQKLKNASKRVDEVYQNQISRNYYFNKFLEEKGIKPLQQDKKNQFKETKDPKNTQKNLSSLQKQLDEKQKEIVEKNKEIGDKTKTIIDKNKVIDSLSIQLRQYKAKLQQKQGEFKDKEKQLLQQKQKYQNLVVLRKNEELFYQRIVQYNKKQQNEKFLIQKIQKENQLLKKEIEQMQEMNNKIILQKSKHEETISLMKQRNKQYQQEIDHLQQTLKIKQNQLSNSQESLQAQREKVRELQQMIGQMKKQQTKIIENTSYQNIPSAEQLDKQAQYRKYQSEIEKLTNKIKDLQDKSNELSLLLLNKQVYNHQSVLQKLKQLKQIILVAQTLRQKQHERLQEMHLQRMHQEYVQKKFNELSRQFKKVTGKLGAVTNQAQLGWKLLKETNNEVVLLNLKRLNEVYKSQAEQLQ